MESSIAIGGPLACNPTIDTRYVPHQVLKLTDSRWIRINSVWDRIEKALYLVIDGALNWYFIHVVKSNLVEHGLEKYNALVRFNQRIIVVSLIMDVAIIGAMSMPNGFV